MKTITFYSYKGGVGRSLALSNIAIRLSELNKKVCVLDFDLEAPGLHFKFENYSRSNKIEKGIVDYIDEFSTNKLIPKSIKDYAIELIPANKIFEPIQLIPAGNIDDSNYWKKLSCINWASMFYENDSKGIEFFLDLKHKIETEIQPDFLLIDSRTGITDIAGITLKLLADEAVILAANNEENMYGSKKIIKSLIDKENLLFGKTPKIIFVLTRLPFTDAAKDKEKELAIINRRTQECKKALGLPEFEIMVIHSDRRLEESERPLIGDDYEAKGVSISNDYLKLFDKLTEDVLTNEEVIIFKNKKYAEKEFLNGLNEKDTTKKIARFNKAIELDETQFEYYVQRGMTYDGIKNYEQGKKDFHLALDLNPDSVVVINNLSGTYLRNEELSQALKYAEISIKKDKNNWYPYWVKSWIFRVENNIEKCLETLNTILDTINPDLDFILNSRADILRFLGLYSQAYKDIFRAIEINPDNPLYFGTLAEIYADEGREEEFYLNLNIALSKGIDIKTLESAKDVFNKFKKQERFIQLMDKYSIDINQILEE